MGSAAFAQIDLSVISTYETGVFDDGAAEIVSYDTTNQQLVFTSAANNEVEIVDFSDPDNLVSVATIDLSPYGGGVNSVKAFNGYFVVAVEADEKQDNGSVVFFDNQGQFVAQIEAGALPDMVAVSKDGTKVVVANEGEPNDDWTRDPAGSITVIDISGGVASVTQANATQITFDGLTLDAGVRIFGANDTLVHIDDDFEVDSIGIDNWNSVALTTNNAWFYDEYNGEHYAEASGYNTSLPNNTPADAWLISDPVDVRDYGFIELSFVNTKAYYDDLGGGTFNALVSADYDSSALPTVATWDTISFTRSPGNFTATQSGTIDLSAYTGNVIHVAFHYTSSGSVSDSCETWQIDDVMLKAAYGSKLTTNNIEPEYVAISDNSDYAYVALQENNALAIVDLMTNTIVDVVPFGAKDHSVAGMGLDPSDKDSGIKIAEHPVYGLYLPDAIAYATINGSGYVLTANEGDSRDYDAYSEEERIKDITLDATAFPNAAELQEDTVLGRLNITISMGDTDNDGEFEELYAYGARSFTIWNAADGSIVWDSGDEFEQYTAQAYPNDFNSNNDENDSFESRSDNKGPEPEAITVATLNGEPHAFIGMERMGGVFVYNIADPTAPEYVTYVNNRDFSVDAELSGGGTNPAVGDLGVEDVIVIDAAVSPDGRTFVVTSNEISGTVTVFEVTGLVGTEELNNEEIALSVYPNPANGTEVRFNKMGDYTIYDLSGRTLIQVTNAQTVNVSNLASGVYVIKNELGETVSLVKK